MQHALMTVCSFIVKVTILSWHITNTDHWPQGFDRTEFLDNGLSMCYPLNIKHQSDHSYSAQTFRNSSNSKRNSKKLFKFEKARNRLVKYRLLTVIVSPWDSSSKKTTPSLLELRETAISYRLSFERDRDLTIMAYHWFCILSFSTIWDVRFNRDQEKNQRNRVWLRTFAGTSP